MFAFIVLLLSTVTLEPAVERLSPAEVRALVDSNEAVVVDVRGSVPYALGHVENAVWMPIGLMAERSAELPKGKLLVLYCTCAKEELSLDAAATLQKLGFERVGVLVGGYPAWKDAGYPTASTRSGAPPAAAPSALPASGRLMPPPSIPCDRNQLTSYAGPVTHYRRLRGKTVLTIDSESGQETVTLRHRGSDDPSASFLIDSQPFTNDDWKRIEARKGELHPKMTAIAWVCSDGRTFVDWRPGTTQAAE